MFDVRHSFSFSKLHSTIPCTHTLYTPPYIPFHPDGYISANSPFHDRPLCTDQHLPRNTVYSFAIRYLGVADWVKGETGLKLSSPLPPPHLDSVMSLPLVFPFPTTTSTTCLFSPNLANFFCFLCLILMGGSAPMPHHCNVSERNVSFVEEFEGCIVYSSSLSK